MRLCVYVFALHYLELLNNTLSLCDFDEYVAGRRAHAGTLWHIYHTPLHVYTRTQTFIMHIKIDMHTLTHAAVVSL
jgi:hypothetical protein